MTKKNQANKIKQELYIEFSQDGVVRETIYPTRSELSSKTGITIGSSYDADITIKDDAVGKVVPFIKKSKHGSGLELAIPQNVSGELVKNQHKIDLTALVETKLIEDARGLHLVDLTEDISFELNNGDEKIKIGFNPILSLKTGKNVFKGKHNMFFLMVLVASLILHTISAQKLKNVEIKEVTGKEKLEKMDERFARLILKPKPKPKVVKVKKEKKPEEKPKDITEKKKPVKKKSELAKKQPKKKEHKARHVSDVMAKKVQSKGLLQAMSKDGGIFSSIDNFDLWSSVDTIIDDASTNKRNELDVAYGDVDYSNAEIDMNLDGSQKSSADNFRAKRKLSSIEKRKEAEASIDKGNTRNESQVYPRIKSYSGGLKFIYNKSLRSNPTLKGSLTVSLTIGPDGLISNVDIIKSTLNDSALDKSLVDRMYKWKFGELQDSPDFIIQYTFDFTPLG